MFWAAFFTSPIRDKTGDVVQHFVSVVDLTKHKQGEDRLRFLLAELNHRTQNTLATVQAIAVQTLRGAADKEVVDTFEGRILALSKAHSLLGRKDWERVSLRDVIDQILQPFGLNDRRVARFSVGGEDVRLQPKAALTLAMVFHELATNDKDSLLDGYRTVPVLQKPFHRSELVDTLAKLLTPKERSVESVMAAVAET